MDVEQGLRPKAQKQAAPLTTERAAPRLKTALANVAVLVITLVLLLFLGEILMRVLFATSMDFDLEMWKYATLIKMPLDDPALGYTHRPNASAFLMGVEITTNRFGLRGDETTLEKPPGTYRIAVVGDSITLGWGVPQGETYPAQLERLFNDAPPDGFPTNVHYEVLNLGIGNYNTAQEVARLRAEGLRFEPDLIALGYFINDAEPTPHPKRGFLIENSYLAVFLVSRFQALAADNARALSYADYYRGLYADGQPGWQAAQDALAELVQIGQERGIPVAVFIIPELHDLSADYPFAAAHAAVIAVGERVGLPVVDLLPVFSGYAPEEDLWVSPTDAHHNATAQAMLAEGIYAALDRGIAGP